MQDKEEEGAMSDELYGMSHLPNLEFLPDKKNLF